MELMKRFLSIPNCLVAPHDVDDPVNHKYVIVTFIAPLLLVLAPADPNFIFNPRMQIIIFTWSRHFIFLHQSHVKIYLK